MSSPASSRLEPAGELPHGGGASGRLSLFAFFLCGISMSFLGALLPAWRYHLEAGFVEVGNYFLDLAAGFVLSAAVGNTLLRGQGPKFVLILANALACSGFMLLAAASLPSFAGWRLAGVLLIGVSAGLLSAGMFEIASPSHPQALGTTTNLAGVLFGCGCLLTALLVAGTYYVYTVPSILILLALVPGFSAGFYAKSQLPQRPVFRGFGFSQIWRDLKNPGAILFALLLFVQFGNEWSIAGWLPLFLMRRLGINPETSLLVLALYWAALLVGRLVSQWIIPRVTTVALLAGSVLSALLGTIVLSSTDNRFGAVMGILFLGAGYAPIFPLVIQTIGHRFPEYRPGVFNGLFALAVMGGLLAPWAVGLIAEQWGIRAVMILPLLGTFTVFLLILLILLEAKLSRLAAPKGSGF